MRRKADLSLRVEGKVESNEVKSTMYAKGLKSYIDIELCIRELTISTVKSSRR